MNPENIVALSTMLVAIGGTLSPVVFWAIQKIVKPFVKDGRLIPIYAILIGAALFLAIINNIPIAAVLFLLEITGQPLINGIPVAMAMASAYLTIYFLKKFAPKKSRKV